MNTKNITLSLMLLLLTSSVFAQGYRVNRTNEKTKAKIKPSGLGKNIISFSPIQYYVAGSNYSNEVYNNASVGISYERVFNNEMLSVKLPVSFTLERRGLYFQPTIKFYPKRQGVVKYAVGPQFLVSYLEDSYYPPYSSFYVRKIENRTQYGFGINNSINFTISRHLYMALDATLGILYYDSFSDYYKNNYYYNGYDNFGIYSLNNTFHIGYSCGFRF